MKKRALTLVTGLVLAGISLGVTACTQAPAPVAAAPADTSAPAAAPAPPVVVEERRVVVEEKRPSPAVDVKVQKKDDGDHKSVDVQVRP
jgi:hypothetical protein